MLMCFYSVRVSTYCIVKGGGALCEQLNGPLSILSFFIFYCSYFPSLYMKLFSYVSVVRNIKIVFY